MGNLTFYLVYFTFRLIAFLPLRVLYLLSDFIFFIAFYIVKYRKQVVYENLDHSFPDKKPSEIDLIAKKFYRHLCDVIVEIIYLTGMGEEEMRRRVKYSNIEILDSYFSEGRHVAAVIGHYGNWEWLSGFQLHTKYQSVTIYRRLKSEVFDRFMIRLRSRFGVQLSEMRMVVRKIYELDREGVPSLFAFISDQAPPVNRTIHWVNFLNQDTPVYLGAEQIAKKWDMAVVFFKPKKVKRGFYEIDFVPIADKASETDMYKITDAHVKELEKLITESPELWLWSHRRWKVKRN